MSQNCLELRKAAKYILPGFNHPDIDFLLPAGAPDPCTQILEFLGIHIFRPIACCSAA
jgi:hypothetical protein